MYTYILIYIYTCICICIYVYMHEHANYTCVHTNMYIYIYTYLYISIDAYVHVWYLCISEANVHMCMCVEFRVRGFKGMIRSQAWGLDLDAVVKIVWGTNRITRYSIATKKPDQELQLVVMPQQSRMRTIPWRHVIESKVVRASWNLSTGGYFLELHLNQWFYLQEQIRLWEALCLDNYLHRKLEWRMHV